MGPLLLSDFIYRLCGNPDICTSVAPALEQDLPITLSPSELAVTGAAQWAIWAGEGGQF